MRSKIQLLACLVLMLIVGCTGGSGPNGMLGQTAPKATFSPLGNTKVTKSFADYKGKVVLVDVWATWCGPCQMIIPGVQKLHDQYKDKGLEVVAVSSEDSATIEKFRKEHDLTYPMYTDPGSSVQSAFGADGIPLTFVLDRDGRVVFVQEGVSGSDPDGPIRKAVADAIGG